MKYVIQKETGLAETTVVELEGGLEVLKEAQAAYKTIDDRLWQTNRKIVEVREFIAQIKDPNYRYLFVSFFDTLMGISSQAEPLQRKFNVEAPKDFETWVTAKGGK